MILVHIATKDENQAIEIADFLVGERLILDALLMEGTMRKRHSVHGIIIEPQFLVLGKTKALLFDQIDRTLRDKYKSDMPVLYSVPIVHMDWDQSSELIEKTEKV